MENKPEPVPYIVHEGILARMERSNRRLFIIVLVLIAVLAASWIGFIAYESQFEDIAITADQDSESGNNYALGGDYYGTAEGNN